MKVGDLVRLVPIASRPRWVAGQNLDVGIVVGFKGTDVLVFWNENFPNEWEYPEQLEVINESR